MEQNHVNLNTFQGGLQNLTKGWFAEMNGKHVAKRHCFHEFPKCCHAGVSVPLSGKITFKKIQGNDVNLIRISRFKLVLLLTGCQYHS